jgi:radical SAM superfamily enzyme YgiQ (UPF0313 family)
MEDAMRILFVSSNRLKRVMPPMPLGLASVIAQVDDARHEIRVLDLMFSERPEEELKAILADFAPDVVAISIRNLDNQSYLNTEYLLPKVKRIVDLCREGSEATIVIGGAAFTVTPLAVYEYMEADFGIVGEAEIAFPMLIERLDAKVDPSDIPGLVWREAGGVRMNPIRHVENLDALRLPRRDLFDNQRYMAAGGFGNIVIKQGCSFRCLYCDSPHTMGPRWRMKSPERVVDELVSMQRDFGINVAFFTDAVFNYPVEHAREVCRAILRRGVQMFWVGTAHPAFADRELLELMHEAGCNAMSLASDTLSERMLEVLRKDITKEEIRHTAEILEELGMNYILSLLVGGPGETRETVEETVKFAAERTPFMLDFCVGIRLMPNTGLFDIAVKEGVISADDPLMEPKFYVSRDVKDWVEDYLNEVCLEHPNWSISREE